MPLYTEEIYRDPRSKSHVHDESLQGSWELPGKQQRHAPGKPATKHHKTVSNLTHACSSLSDLHGGHGRPGVLTVGILSKCEVSNPLPLFKIKRVL